MATQLRPNWTQFDDGTPVPPTGLTFYGAVAQPVPDAVQAITIIEQAGYLSIEMDSDGGDVIFTCWEAALPGGNLTATTRQIGGEYTLSLPSNPALEPTIVVPFYLRWIDPAPMQSGMYMLAHDTATINDVVVSDPRQPAITTVGP